MDVFFDADNANKKLTLQTVLLTHLEAFFDAVLTGRPFEEFVLPIERAKKNLEGFDERISKR